jgi:DNA-binding transcriptional MerR regulator
LSPTEAARRLGVTVKALKVYERLGLITPQRTAADWRVYGPEQIARVQEIVALKTLGLSLARIGALLQGHDADIGRALALQESALREQRGRIDQTLARVTLLRGRLAAGEPVAAAEIAAVAQGLSAPPADLGALLQRHYERYLGPRAWTEAPGIAAFSAETWDALVAELKRLTADAIDPRDPAALAFHARWKTASDAVARADPALGAVGYAAWLDALDDPQTAAQLPFGRPEMDYLARVTASAMAEAARRVPPPA